MGVEFNERPQTPDEVVNAQEDVKYGTSTGDVEVQAAVAPRRQGSVVDRKTQMIDLTRLKNVDPDLTELLAEMDLDGDGTINAAELARAMGVIKDTREEKDEWQKVAFRRLVMFVVALVINVALIGVVTYYIVWSTAAVRVDEDGNLVNKHEEAGDDDDEDAKPEPLVTQTMQEEDYGVADLFDSDMYGSIDMFSYSLGDVETENGKVIYLNPIGYSQFEREVDVDGENYHMDVVVAYIDGTSAVIIENPIIADGEYEIDPMEPYTITGITFGEVDADTLAEKKPSYDSTATVRQLRAAKGTNRASTRRNAKTSQQIIRLYKNHDTSKSLMQTGRGRGLLLQLKNDKVRGFFRKTNKKTARKGGANAKKKGTPKGAKKNEKKAAKKAAKKSKSSKK
jgi:hypothetical protein